LTLELSALTMCVGTYSRSFKEAQGFGALMMPLPFLPLVVSLALPLSNQPWLAPVPVVGQFALARDVFAGAALSPWWFVVAAVSALAGALALVGLAGRLLRRESIVFS
jgi:sodium transport system permease protein